MNIKDNINKYKKKMFLLNFGAVIKKWVMGLLVYYFSQPTTGYISQKQLFHFIMALKRNGFEKCQARLELVPPQAQHIIAPFRDKEYK